jgi:xylulokinase/glycerol kinase
MRGIIFDKTGSALETKAIKYHPIYGENGIYVEQDPLEYKEALYQILEWAGEQAKRLPGFLEAISLTSQRSSCICLDWSGEPIGHAICWQDKRTVPLCRKLERYGTVVAQKSGAWINPVYFAPKLTWIRENCKDVYSRVWKFVNIADYLVYLMTGQARTDDTYGSRTHLMDLRTRDWDPMLLDIFEVERDKLCQIYPVGSVLGILRPEVAALTGLPEGLPVFSAGGDQQCAVIGQGVCGPGTASVTLGTGEYIATEIQRLPEIRSDEVIYNASAISGEYVVEYGAVTCCSGLDWILKEIYPALPYRRIGKELQKSKPGAAGCISLPYFQGRITPDHNSDAKAIFAGISLSTTKADLLRAFVEGIGYETDYGIGVMPQKPRRILVNGGLTGTPEICQILADVLGQPIYINGEADATAFGAFLVTQVSRGIYSDVAAAYNSLHAQPQLTAYEPDLSLHRLYQQQMQGNRLLYEKVYGGQYEGRKKSVS